jgi:hypothetical protein
MASMVRGCEGIQNGPMNGPMNGVSICKDHHFGLEESKEVSRRTLAPKVQ